MSQKTNDFLDKIVNGPNIKAAIQSIRSEYPGHVIKPDQSEANLEQTFDNDFPAIDKKDTMAVSREPEQGARGREAHQQDYKRQPLSSHEL